MRIIDYVVVALRNLWRRKLRSFLTISAVVIGAVSVIIMLSLVVGAKKVMVKQIESMGAFRLVTVTGDPNAEGGDLFGGNQSPDDNAKKLDARVLSRLSALPHVAAVTPSASVWVKSIKLEGSERKAWANLLGYQPDAHVFNVPLAAGRALRNNDMAKVVLSGQAVRRLGFAGKPREIVGKNVLLVMDGWSYYSDWTEDPPMPPQDGKDEDRKKAGDAEKTIKAEVIGVGAPGPGDNSNFVSLAWARKLMVQKRWEFDGSPERMGMTIVREDMIAKQGYSAIMLKVDATANVKRVSGAVAALGFGVTSAQEMLDGISKVFVILGLIAGAVGGISLLVACIGIINTMVMATYERTREIGVMRACGATRACVRRLFTLEAALIGLLGGGAALAVSFGLAQIANLVFDKIAAEQSVPISGLISFPVWLLAGVLALTASVGMAAGIYPARRAARLDPVEALRYE